MMCSPSGFVFILIATLIWNCLHFECAVHDNNNNNNISASSNNSSNANKTLVSNRSWFSKTTASHSHVAPAVGHNERVADNTRSSSSSSTHNASNTNSSTNANGNARAVGGRRLRIDITRKHSVHLNGVEIKESSLADHLAEHEKELIFGKEKEGRPLKLVHLQHLTDASDVDGGNAVDAAATFAADPVTPAAFKSQPKQQPTHQSSHRVKRSDTSATAESQSADAQPQAASVPSEDVVSVQIKDNDQSVHLQLRQTPKLIDDAFVFIRRYANSTQFIEDSHKLAERYERCFYSNENSALDLCDDENVRGVFHHNSTNYIIHPLPARFGNSTHVILESNYHLPPKDTRESAVMPLAASVLNASVQFEPEEEGFNELNDFPLEPTISEYTARPVRNTGYVTHEEYTEDTTHNYTYHHNGRDDKLKKYVDINLRYKPRYHHHNNGEKQQQFQRQKYQRQRQHLHRQQQEALSAKQKPEKLPQRQRKLKEHHQHRKQQQAKAASTLLDHIDLMHDDNNNNAENVVKSKKHDDQPQRRRRRRRRNIASGSTMIPQDLYIETAIFVDRDLFQHMSKNFPDNTESQMIRFVLAMINAVQLLYHDRSLGRRINFVLKRLEILYNDPASLRRSDDIDTYLSNFCEWQQRLNPPQDSDTMHYDHAVILTGLDLYVVDKGGKKINQVVGLAPVSGMCTNTSSCTINEGKHFESVFVVAHEIGHNLGMRHDTINDRNCDPSRYIMSPTLGSGKTTWSDCSRDYLEKFLRKGLGSCLFDHGQFANNLDHLAEGILPGERFDADQQCMLKYGRPSMRAKNQKQSDICTDLHCQRDRHTWTSHPALEGTTCGPNMWCRSGTCVIRPAYVEPYHTPKLASTASKVGYEKSNFLESSKTGHYLHEYNYNKPVSWSEWSEASECASGCLYGPSRRLLEGSTGLRTYSRRCVDHYRRCLGPAHKYESCVAKDCYSSKIVMTIEEFAYDKCIRAQKSDAELTGEGVQIIGDIEESCKVYCRTKTNGTKTRRWTFPEGTTCRTTLYKTEDISYCIGGRCEKFSCDNSTHNYYKLDPHFCEQRRTSPARAEESESRRYNTVHAATASGNNLGYNKNYHNNNNIPQYNIYAPTTYRSKYENEVAVRSFHGQERESPYKRKSGGYQPWNKYSYPLRDTAQPVAQPQPPKPPPPVSASLVALDTAVTAAAAEPEWIVKSGCHSSCMAKSKGIQVVTSRRTGANNIQLCTHTAKPCERLLSATEHAEHTCARYKQKVRGLSGYGTQIAASVDEPDRSCRVGCQDESIKYRFYLVNGRYGHFPLGTKCSNTEERYCVNGKCLEFGPDNIPLQQSHISLALFRSRRRRSLPSFDDGLSQREPVLPTVESVRQRRSYLYFDPVNITETITQDFINSIVMSIMDFEQKSVEDELLNRDHIEFNNPIHIATEEEATTELQATT
ncbi:uncharacterized protein LOC105226273 [Bactrocera dorsalis]|uniref:Uncharacterized protein LOC105226273 n=1 Tax=Bactrocera dorsalis TaxID=27457 RepID=A0ABM3JET9_BACDO|nr:uncharacterized protein LOC105226273 [Bactrocera dorsalis]XP_049307737.1 uncharacterized protein LOC105226273 [Bactrocera dorsalis]XP_049307738.1 uncharacterized protein LOC105226273 [Bactrocera dorsalis]